MWMVVSMCKMDVLYDSVRMSRVAVMDGNVCKGPFKRYVTLNWQILGPTGS